MTRPEIEAALADIHNVAWGDEIAHVREDELHTKFIQHVARTAGGELAECAELVLSTKKIIFSRWYA